MISWSWWPICRYYKTKAAREEARKARLCVESCQILSCCPVHQWYHMTLVQNRIRKLLLDWHTKQQQTGENSVLSKPGTPSGPGHCHHLENWDKINCRWGQCFYRAHLAAHVQTKLTVWMISRIDSWYRACRMCEKGFPFAKQSAAVRLWCLFVCVCPDIQTSRKHFDPSKKLQ